MRWPRLTRRSGHVAAPDGSADQYKPGSWGQASLPPVDLANAPTGNVEVIQAPPPSPPAAPSPAPEVLAPPLVAPPAEVAPLLCAAEPPPAAIPPAPFPSVPMPSVTATPGEDEGAASGVRLGFEDGSDVHLDPDHPHSLALKAIADVLLHRGPRHRRVG